MNKTTTTTTAPTTCTVRFATTGPCGEPAVQIVVTPSGKKFAECAAHASPPVGRIRVIPVDSGEVLTAAPVAPFAVGDTVAVGHGGIRKVGVVTAVRRTRATVEVPNRDGVKEIDRNFDEIEPVR